VAVAAKSDPLMMTVVPTGPEEGVNPVITGAGGSTYTNPGSDPPPQGERTIIVCVPGVFVPTTAVIVLSSTIVNDLARLPEDPNRTSEA
jgi:hypothetical protein